MFSLKLMIGALSAADAEVSFADTGFSTKLVEAFPLDLSSQAPKMNKEHKEAAKSILFIFIKVNSANLMTGFDFQS